MNITTKRRTANSRPVLQCFTAVVCQYTVNSMCDINQWTSLQNNEQQTADLCSSVSLLWYVSIQWTVCVILTSEHHYKTTKSKQQTCAPVFHCCGMSVYSEQHSHLLPVCNTTATNNHILVTNYVILVTNKISKS